MKTILRQSKGRDTIPNTEILTTLFYSYYSVTVFSITLPKLCASTTRGYDFWVMIKMGVTDLEQF